MSGVNKVILIGRLGQDPETKFMPNGNAVTNISVATSEKWKDKTTGQPQEKTEWHRVVFFNKLAEVAGQYLTKGSNVYIEGKLETRKWQDKSGADRYTTEVKAHAMQMLDSKGEGQPQQAQQAPQQYQQAPQQQAPQMQAGYGQPQQVPQAQQDQQRQAQQQQNQQVTQQVQQMQQQPAPNLDDDIPF